MLELPPLSGPPRIFLGLPIYDHMRPEAVASSLAEVMFAEPRCTGYSAPRGMLIQHARNEIAYQALKAWRAGRATHLWWLDADMILPDLIWAEVHGQSVALGTAARLVAHNLPFVSGLCFNAEGDPVVRRENKERHRYETLVDLPPAGVVACDLVGLACVLMRIELIDLMIRRYKDLPFQMPVFRLQDREIHESEDVFTAFETTGEDTFFIQRLREMGVPIRVDCGLSIGHLKAHVIDRKRAALLRTDRALAPA